MDLGIFIPIGNNGWLISNASPQYMPTYDLNTRGRPARGCGSASSSRSP